IQAIRSLEVDPSRLAGALNAVLESDDSAVMSHALEALVDAGPRATPLLIEALKGDRSAYWAALAISEIGPEAAGCSDALAALCAGGNDPDTLSQALVAAAKIGPEARVVAPVAQKIAAETDSDHVRIAACYALGAVGDESATALLVDLFNGGGEFQKMVCAWSLAKLHPDDPVAEEKAISLLTAALKSDRPEVRGAAAEGLKLLGAPKAKLAAAFVEVVADASDADKVNIADALAGLGPEVAPAMINELANPQTRDVAIEVLARLGPQAVGAAEGLADQLAECTAEQLAQLQYALAEFGPEATSAADKIAGNLRDTLAEVRHSALYALRKIGAESTAARDELASLMQSAEDEFESFAAAWALAKVDLEAKTLGMVAARLEKALDHPDERVRLETIRAIKDLGPAGSPFADKLADMEENDPSAEVRSAAGE
ncbi:MAG: HEAT repeat domain-containing protein, partial [Planctomycetota bacterium]